MGAIAETVGSGLGGGNVIGVIPAALAPREASAPLVAGFGCWLWLLRQLLRQSLVLVCMWARHSVPHLRAAATKMLQCTRRSDQLSTTGETRRGGAGRLQAPMHPMNVTQGPCLPVRLQISGTTVGEIRVVQSMHERKAMMFEEADAFVTIPGGKWFWEISIS